MVYIMMAAALIGIVCVVTMIVIEKETVCRWVQKPKKDIYLNNVFLDIMVAPSKESFILIVTITGYISLSSGGLEKPSPYLGYIQTHMWNK